MKRNLVNGVAAIAAAITLLTGCGQSRWDDLGETQSMASKGVVFKVKGNFRNSTQETSVNGSSMTDLWILDYVDGVLVQQLHQDDNTAADFGSPTLSLSMGTHELYFVCSMGSGGTVDADAHKITWTTPRDTFWKKVTKNVTGNTGTTAAVSLDRVATRLTVNVEDAIPASVAKLEVKPSTWYYGLDYLTGNGTDVKSEALTINIPDSYVGRTDTKVSIYGMAQEEEFMTNVTMTAKDKDGNVLSTEGIANAPMRKNRSTDYTGTLFLSESSFTININEEWGAPYNGTW